jgi:hypothetical protein
VGACTLAASVGALAEPEADDAELKLDFTWTAPEGCPTRAQVVQELSRAVDAGGKELPPLTARAVVERSGDAWRLELATEMDGRRGTRLLEADSCEGLARAATLVLALTLGEGLARRQQAEAEAVKAAPPAKAPPPAEPKPAPPPRREKKPLQALLWAAAAVGSDPLGSFGPALVLGGAIEPNLLRVGATVTATLPRSTPFAGSGGDLRAYSFGADLEACVAPTLEPFQLSACANASLTLLEVSGRGTALDRRASVPLYGFGPSVGAAWLLDKHAFLSFALVSHFFVKRPELVVEGLQKRTRVESASGSAQLGLGVRW